MEPLSWFGAYGAAFTLPFSLLLTMAITFGLGGVLLGMTDSRPRNALAVFNGIAVVFLLFVIVTYIYQTVSGGGSGISLDAVKWVLIVLVCLGIFAAMLAGFLGRMLDNPAAFMGGALKYTLIGLGILTGLWLLTTLVFQGSAHQAWLDTLDPGAMPSEAEIATHRNTSVLQSRGIMASIFMRFMPVWIALIITFALSRQFRNRLGLYGKLFNSNIGMIGFALVMFWMFTAVFAGAFDMIATHPPLDQMSGMKNKIPGWAYRNAGPEDYPFYLLGGDNLARDVFSRMVYGAAEVAKYAPLATVFAFMVGITLGLPAGYYGGRIDTVLSFLANLILAFPVILLFYLLVTPEITSTGLPQFMAAVLFVFPLIFFAVLIHSKFRTQPQKNTTWLLAVLIPLFLFYAAAINDSGVHSKITFWPLDFFDIAGAVLTMFVSVVFVNSPTVFRIVRGLTMDIHTRDYVAAARTRGERPWYIMLWEILPNARGPLIVDFCLRIGYTTILLGTLGFFGLGLPPESPDWGTTINEGRKLLRVYAHPALPPAFALLTLVLGLNLLADGLREESLKD